MGQGYLCLALLEVMTPLTLLLVTCSLHLKRTLNTYHILGSQTSLSFVAECINIVFTNSDVVITLTRFDLN